MVKILSFVFLFLIIVESAEASSAASRRRRRENRAAEEKCERIAQKLPTSLINCDLISNQEKINMTAWVLDGHSPSKHRYSNPCYKIDRHSSESVINQVAQEHRTTQETVIQCVGENAEKSTAEVVMMAKKQIEEKEKQAMIMMAVVALCVFVLIGVLMASA